MKIFRRKIWLEIERYQRKEFEKKLNHYWKDADGKKRLRQRKRLEQEKEKSGKEKK